MQHFRKLTSLAEDFQKIGILPRDAGLPATSRSLIESDDKDEDEMAECEGDDDKMNEDDGDDADAKKKDDDKKKTESRGGVKAKARFEARKKKAAESRKRRMSRRESIYKARAAKIQEAKKAPTAASRARFGLVQSLGKAANVFESVNVKSLTESKATKPAQVAEALNKVATLAAALGRRFAVLESALISEEVAVGVMHADSEYDWASGAPNMGSAPATGDATDYAQGDKPAAAAPSGDKLEGDDVPKEPEIAEDDSEKNPVVDEDDDWSDEDGDGDVDACDDDMGDDDSEDDDNEDDDDADELDEAALAMDHELAAVRTEAAQAALNVAQGDVSLGDATQLMGDMVSYLGGAMKLYNQVVSSMTKMGYVGQDKPADENLAIPNVTSDGVVIGDGMPKGDTSVAMPQVMGDAAKTGDAIDGQKDAGAAKTESKKK